MGIKEILCVALFVACASASGYDSCPSLFGFYPDSYDCTKFYRCSWGKPFQFTCPYGTRWSQHLLTCAHKDEAPCGKYPAPQQVYHAIPVYPDHAGYYYEPYVHVIPGAHPVNPGYYDYVNSYKAGYPAAYHKK